MKESYDKKDRTDTDIWKLLKEGDREALKILFLRYKRDLYLYAYKLSGDTFLAKDCLHELFYRVWDRREHLGNVESVKSYLWISMRRDVLKAINKNRQEILADNVLPYSRMLAFTSEDFIVHRERREEQGRILADALNKLTDRHREAILLKFFNGMGYHEIEQIMGVNYQTARNYVYHGVKALKEELKDRTFVPASIAAM